MNPDDFTQHPTWKIAQDIQKKRREQGLPEYKFKGTIDNLKSRKGRSINNKAIDTIVNEVTPFEGIEKLSNINHRNVSPTSKNVRANQTAMDKLIDSIMKGKIQ